MHSIEGYGIKNDYEYYSYFYIFCITVSSDKSVPSDNNICSNCEVLTPSFSSVSSDKSATSTSDQGEHTGIC